MVHVKGLVFRSRDMLNLRLFYEALGITLAYEKHGGPSHFSFPVDRQFVVELYQAKSEVNEDMLIVGVA